jgi:hypothetical protein
MANRTMDYLQQAESEIRAAIVGEIAPHLSALGAAVDDLRAALGGGRRGGRGKGAGRKAGRPGRPKGARRRRGGWKKAGAAAKGGRRGKNLPRGALAKAYAQVTKGIADMTPAQITDAVMKLPLFRGRNRRSMYVQIFKLRGKK